MFSKGSKHEAKPTPRSSAPSIISVDLRITGDVISVGDIQLDGLVEGDVQSRSIVVGEEAHVRGSIVAETVRITGTVTGSVRAHTVTLDRTARVQGDIVHHMIGIEQGAYVEGKIERLENPHKSLDIKMGAKEAPGTPPVLTAVEGGANKKAG
ncbi:MAG: polymer-forming cytoskeletal protein [Rhodospirillaceae bacterium]|nr:polymer-forming cytoskeletal protein [Rhodospirillaceae bacterium]